MDLQSSDWVLLPWVNLDEGFGLPECYIDQDDQTQLGSLTSVSLEGSVQNLAI